MLVKQYQENEDKEVIISIHKAINSSLDLRSKLKLIHEFLGTVNPDTDVNNEWKNFVNQQRKTDFDGIITDEKLNQVETYRFVSNSFQDDVMKTTGTDIDVILPPVSRFGGGNRDEKKNRTIARLMAYFELYLDIFYGDDTLDK